MIRDSVKKEGYLLYLFQSLRLKQHIMSHLGSLISDGLGLSVNNRDIFGWDFTFHSVGSIWDGDGLSLHQGRLWSSKETELPESSEGCGELIFWHWSDQSDSSDRAKG